MAILFNINGLFAIDSTGAMELGGAAGASTYVLMSNGAGNANSWYDVQSKFAEYLPLTGGTLTGNLALTDATNNPSLVISTGSLTVGGVTTLNDLDVTDTLAWRVSPTDAARQRADARDDDTTFSRLHWFGKSATAGTSNFRHAYYDGANYINVTAASGAVTFDGILAATGGTSTEWNTSYNRSITAAAVTGTTTKTLTLTQQDTNTITASWTDNDNNTSWPNVGAGTRTNYTLVFKPPTDNYAGFQFLTSAGAGAGYLLIRGESGSGAYTTEGISLIADAGWLSLVSRTTTDKGVRIMAGAAATTRLKIVSAGDITFNEAYTFPKTDGTVNQVLKTDGSGNLDWATDSDSGVSKIIASTNITISPTGGTGDVTISSTNTTYSAGDGINFSGTPATQINADINYISYNGNNNFIDSASNLLGSAIPTQGRLLYRETSNQKIVSMGYVDDLPFSNNSGTVTSSATTSYIPYMSTATNVANSQLLYDTAGSRTILTSTVGPNDDVRGIFVVRDDTAMAANVGGQIALGYRYLSSGGYTEGALIRTYKLNATDGDYSSGLKIQVRNTGTSLSTKFTLDPSGNVTIPGIYNATGGTSTEWNTAYDNTITGLAVTGTTTKTLTATQQDGGTLTASWTDNDSNTTWPNVGAGIRTNYDLGFKPPANSYAGFSFQTAAGAGAGYFLIRGTSDAGSTYRAEGISLIADASWLTLASRTSTTAGVRILSGSTSVERLVIKDNGESYFTGNLGIGTNSPNKALTVYGGNDNGIWIDSQGAQYTSLAFGNNGTEKANIAWDNTNGYTNITTYGSGHLALTTGGGIKAFLNSSGNFGIGTTSPTTKLSITDGASMYADSNYLVQIKRNATNGNDDTSKASILLANNSNAMQIAYGGSTDRLRIIDGGAQERFTLLNGGNVGIGVTGPDQKLQVVGNAHIDYSLLGRSFRAGNRGELHLNATGTTDVSEIFFGYGDGYAENNIRWGISDRGTTDGTLIFYRGPANGGFSEAMYFNTSLNAFIPNGNLGIGTTANGALSEKLFVDGAVRQQSAVGLNTNGSIRTGLGAYDNTTGWGAGIGGQLVLGYIYTGSSYTEGALIKMYKENSTQGHYGSGLRWSVRQNGTNLTAKMQLEPAGSLIVKGDIVAYGSPSDISLKENIKPMSNSLDKVKKLQGVTFDWIQKKDSILDIKEDYGFIAQDVKKVIPELVRKNSNGLLSMRHQGVIPMLVEAIKELEARVKELENK